MRDKSRRRYVVFHNHRKLPKAGYILLFVLFFLAVFLLAWFTQQLGLWPQSWSGNFDGYGE